LTDEAPKPASPAPEKTKRKLPRILYWAAYIAIIAAFSGGVYLLTNMGLPYWLAIVIGGAVTGVAVWFLEDSALNPSRDLDKDPFDRNFIDVNMQMIRSWKLRGKDVAWKKSLAPDLPAHARDAFKEKLGVDPEVSVEADGLLWVAGQRDWYGGYFDPPRFVVVGFDPAGAIKAADDLHTWPKRWTAPAGTVGQPKQS